MTDLLLNFSVVVSYLWPDLLGYSPTTEISPGTKYIGSELCRCWRRRRGSALRGTSGSRRQFSEPSCPSTTRWTMLGGRAAAQSCDRHLLSGFLLLVPPFPPVLATSHVSTDDPRLWLVPDWSYVSIASHSICRPQKDRQMVDALSTLARPRDSALHTHGAPTTTCLSPPVTIAHLKGKIAVACIREERAAPRNQQPAVPLRLTSITKRSRTYF